jgi:hypothetical protein
MLYASDNDQALACSHRFFHGKPRAGEGGDNITPVRNVDTIDATPADPRPWYSIPCTSIGHSYVMRNASVLADLYAVLTSDTPAGRRVRLLPRRHDRSNLDYWLFQAAN